MKTTFTHGTVITPEFLNAINHPVFKESPENDGEIPLPLISMDQLADLSFLDGPALESFFTGLGHNPLGPVSNGPITGAQILEALQAIHASNADRVAILQKLASSLYFPPARLPVFYQARYTGYNGNYNIKSPLIGGNFVAPTNNLLFMQTGGYSSRCNPQQAFVDIVNAPKSVYSSYGNPAQAIPNGVGSVGFFPGIDLNPYISPLSVYLFQDDVASTRVFDLALRALETRDFDWSIPLRFTVDAALTVGQFDSIGFQVCDANGGVYFLLDLPDLFNARTQEFMLRVQRVNGGLRAGCALV